MLHKHHTMSQEFMWAHMMDRVNYICCSLPLVESVDSVIVKPDDVSDYYFCDELVVRVVQRPQVVNKRNSFMALV